MAITTQTVVQHLSKQRLLPDRVIRPGIRRLLAECLTEAASNARLEPYSFIDKASLSA